MEKLLTLLAVINVAFDDLTTAMFDYQERRFDLGFLGCRVIDSLYLMPAIFGLVIANTYPKPFSGMLVSHSATYLVLFLLGKLLFAMIWEAKATPRNSKHLRRDGYGSHPDDSKAIVFWGLAIMIFVASVGTSKFIESAVGARWRDPTQQSYRYTRTQNNYYDKYREVAKKHREQHTWSYDGRAQ